MLRKISLLITGAALSVRALALVAAAYAEELPMIWIDTKDEAGITSKDVYVNMDFRLEHPDNPQLNVTKTGMADSIRGRGNATWNYPKKPYRIKFRDKTSLFGLPAARSWVLLAERNDPTYVKTSFAFELGRRLGLPFTNTYHHVRLYLDGAYNGLYTLTEHRQVNPGRVDIDKNEGWLVEVSSYFDEHPRFRTEKYDLPVMILSPEPPGPTDMDNPAYHFVRDDWNELCDFMRSPDFPENGYRDLIDMETFVKYFMIHTLMNNRDYTYYDSNITWVGSTYFYKDKGGKISAGPLWDFDNTFWSTNDLSPLNMDVVREYPYPQLPFFNRFLQDPLFYALWKEIWEDSRDIIISMSEFIDVMAEKLRDAALEDYKLWRPAWQYPDYVFSVKRVKDYFELRFEYLDSLYRNTDALPLDMYASIARRIDGVRGGDESKTASVSVRNKTLTVRSPSDAVTRVRLIDMRGKTVANFTNRGTARISLAGIPAGRYLVEVRQGGGGKRDMAPVIIGVR